MNKNKSKGFKANPSIDRECFNRESTIVLKDSDKSRITTTLAKSSCTQNVLKWKLTSQDIPVAITCWVGAHGGWATLTLECELADDNFSKCSDLCIKIPINGQAEITR